MYNIDELFSEIPGNTPHGMPTARDMIDRAVDEELDVVLSDPSTLMDWISELKGKQRQTFGQSLCFLLTHYPVNVSGMPTMLRWEAGEPVRGSAAWIMRNVVGVEVETEVEKRYSD